LNVLKSVRKWHSDDSEVNLHMGLAFAFQKKRDLAIKEFQKAIRIDPDYDLPYYYSGIQYFNSHPNLSKKNLIKFLELSYKNSDNQDLVLKAQQLLGRL